MRRIKYTSLFVSMLIAFSLMFLFQKTTLGAGPSFGNEGQICNKTNFPTQKCDVSFFNQGKCSCNNIDLFCVSESGNIICRYCDNGDSCCTNASKGNFCAKGYTCNMTTKTCETTGPDWDSCDSVGDTCCTEASVKKCAPSNSYIQCNTSTDKCELKPCGAVGQVCCGTSCNGTAVCKGGWCTAGSTIPSTSHPDYTYGGLYFGDLEAVIAPIAKILFYASLLIGVVLIIYSGYVLMTSEGNPQRVQQGQEQLTAAILGIMFILLSAAILRVIINSIILGT